MQNGLDDSGGNVVFSDHLCANCDLLRHSAIRDAILSPMQWMRNCGGVRLIRGHRYPASMMLHDFEEAQDPTVLRVPRGLEYCTIRL